MKIETVKSVGLKALRSFKIAVLAMVSLSFVMMSCDKDDDDDETLLTLDGTPTFYLPIYALVGDTLVMHASGVTTPGAYYEWKCEGLDSVSVSSDGLTLTVVAPDSVAVYDVTLTADYGDEYYSSSLVQYVTVLKESCLTGTDTSEVTFTDPRDGNVYGIVEIGNLQWMDRNLNWAGAGEGFGKTDAAALLFGRLYTWDDATGGVSASGLGNGVQGVCPPGWSIPTNEDWVDLAMAVNGGKETTFLDNWEGIAQDLMAPAYFNGKAVWTYSPDVTPNNKYGWNALAAGCSMNNYNNYTNMLTYGFWWSSTEKDSKTAHYKYMYSEFPDVSVNYCAKDGMGASVRCVRLK